MKDNQIKNFIQYLNNPLGLWFLSTLVVGPFLYCFNTYIPNQQRKEIEREKEEEKIERIELELGYRYVATINNLKSLHSDINSKNYQTKVLKAFEYFATENYGNKSIFDEFRSADSYTLMVNLIYYKKEKQAKIVLASSLKDCFLFVRGLSDLDSYEYKKHPIDLAVEFKDRLSVLSYKDFENLDLPYKKICKKDDDFC